MRVMVLYNPISGAGRSRAAAQTLGAAIDRVGYEATLAETQRAPAAGHGYF